MREETKRKFDRLHACERRRLWTAIAFGAVMTIGLGFWLLPSGESRHVAAIVRTAAFQHNPDTGQPFMWIESQLENGKIVRASGVWPRLPDRGAKIVMTGHAGRLGFHGYSWHGILANGQSAGTDR